MPRRFPPPWSVDETGACFIVKDGAGQTLAYVYFEDEPGAPVCGKPAHQRRSAALRHHGSVFNANSRSPL